MQAIIASEATLAFTSITTDVNVTSMYCDQTSFLGSWMGLAIRAEGRGILREN